MSLSEHPLFAEFDRRFMTVLGWLAGAAVPVLFAVGWVLGTLRLLTFTELEELVRLKDRFLASVSRGSVVVSAASQPDVDRYQEQALRTSNAQLESFASVAAHDLQEPLRKIRAFSDRVRLLLDPDADKALDYLGRADAAAAQMQTLITDLLALARLRGRPPERVALSLDDTLEAVLQDLADRIEEAGATFDISPLPDMVADPSQMRQLFINLIGNSLKYRQPETRLHVTVGAEPTAGRVVIRVRDNGIGFSNHYLTKIFAPLERLHSRDEYEGTGVGLALCRTIVERHGGTITAQGEPGEGAEFVVDLPAS